MKTFTIAYTTTKVYQIEITADNESEAYERADDAYCDFDNNDWKESYEETMSVKIVDESEEKETRYRHIGYYNDIEDVSYLSRKSAEEIVNYYKKGYGHFYPDNDSCAETDLIAEEETMTVITGDVKFTKDNKYAISDTTPSDGISYINDGYYIDIYEKY